MLSGPAIVLLKRLSAIAHVGPTRAIGRGSTSVGMTLLDALGIDASSIEKASFMGIAVTARRELPAAPRNRVNLFARVPDWGQSTCKSSAEIVARYGYDSSFGVRKLYCTVRARHPNSQGLFLEVNPIKETLDEMAATRVGQEHVASWPITELRRRLVSTHPESIWVAARVIWRGDTEYFHYRKAVYTGTPIAERLDTLITQGTVTVDHLIETREGRTREKGPLFKIHPLNLSMLFPSSPVFDLLSIDPASFGS
jgi:hypothetical protein